MIRHWGDTVFFDDHAEGAWPNGARVVKLRKIDKEELTEVGMFGTVLGSMSMPLDAIEEQAKRGLEGVTHGYFVEWDNNKRLPVFCIDAKLGLLNDAA